MKKLGFLLAGLLVFANSAFAQLGSLSTDLVFTPVTPCRIMDTRGTGPRTGILAAGSTRTFFGLSSATNYTGQGGNSPSCSVPLTSNVAAIVVNFTTVSPDAGGYITAFPGDVADIDKPVAATVNFIAGSVIGNNATLKLAQTLSNGDFKIFSTANVHVVGDIVGYYIKPVSAGSLECIDTASLGSTALPASGTATVSSSACTTGYAMTGGSCLGSSFGANVVTSRVNGSVYFCAYQNSSASATQVEALGRCCRIPGR